MHINFGNTGLSSKERVKRTFSKQLTDRVPISYFGNGGITNKALNAFSAKDYPGLLKALSADIIGVSAPYIGKKLHPDKHGYIITPFGVHMKWIANASGGYYDYCDFPLENATADEIRNFPMPSPLDYDYNAALESCKKYGGKFAIHAGSAGLVDIINANGRLRGMEQTLIDIATDTEEGNILTEKRVNIEYEVLKRFLEKCSEYIDFLWIGEDLGTQISQMISLKHFRKKIRPYHQKFIDLAKNYDLPVMMHSCGYSSWAFEDFIDMGIDAVDTLQPEAFNMQPKYLKETYSQRLCFHGCISTAGALAYGTPDEVEKTVKDTLEIMMPGGGYFFAPTHLIQDNTPLENLERMYQSVQKYGYYK